MRIFKTKINGKTLKEKQTQAFTTDMILALAIIFANGCEAQGEVKDKMRYLPSQQIKGLRIG